ncbi:MAG: glycosyl transferase [Pseudomonadota bacterium]
MNKSVAAVTICAKNYFAKAKVLSKSYLDFHPDHSFYILIMDRKDEAFATRHAEYNLIWVEDLAIPDLYKHAFSYDVIEFSTNVKPTILKFLLQKYSKALYIDPDIQIYNYLGPVFDALDNHAITITPHTLTPVLDGKHPNDIDFLKFGAYNLGFVGVSQADEALSFLDWWSSRCLAFGFYEPQLGLAVDQKWIDLVPSYFPTTKIMRDLGLNLSFWNLHERFLSKTEGMWFVNDVSPLYFIHFSSFDVKNPTAIASKQNRFLKGDRPDTTELYEQYALSLKEQDAENYSINQYSFDFFEDGVYITATMRRFYACLSERFSDEINPFSSTSKVRLFGERKGLVSRKLMPMKRQNFKNMDDYTLQLSIIYFMLRVTLRVFGPVRYFALMRLLPQLSSIRNQEKVIGD